MANGSLRLREYPAEWRSRLMSRTLGALWSVVSCVAGPPPLAPGQPARDVTVHIVLNDFGPLGRAYCETDEAEADEESVVENILSGEYSHPLRVVAFNTAEGWARDVTEDIARAVLDRARSENRSIGKASQEILRNALGADAAELLS